MPVVYFTKVGPDISKISRRLLETVIKNEKIKLNKTVPLKVHFGEKGNVTFIKPKNFDGIIDFLNEKKIKSSFMETSTIYGGQRYREDLHKKTAKEHGFTRLPVIIADKDGHDFVDVEINKKHYKTCKIGKAFLDYDQLIVISHFKGHTLTGFGGAMKQLAMGYCSKGAKLDMHMGIKPRIKSRKCTQCHDCLERCNYDALNIGPKSYIDHVKCVGCGACIPVCPTKAITIFSLKGILNALLEWNLFKEKMVEYALAAQKDRQNIYISFAMSITKSCDCLPTKMKPIMDDIGIFASTDPVAIDRACYDMAKKQGKKFGGFSQFAYAESIGLGKQKYKLIKI